VFQILYKPEHESAKETKGTKKYFHTFRQYINVISSEARNLRFFASFRMTYSDAGEVCKDGDINLRDAVTTLKVLAGESLSVSLSADINGDKQIGLAEAIFILRYVAGLF